MISHLLISLQRLGPNRPEVEIFGNYRGFLVGELQDGISKREGTAFDSYNIIKLVRNFS